MNKYTFIAALFAASFVALAPAQQTSTSNLDRESYEDRSAQELRQLRAQVDAAARSAPQADRARFAPVYDALIQAEDALAALKTAAALDESSRRQEFEIARAKASRVWSDFRVTRSPDVNTAQNGSSS
jgi:hypothetical protein